MNKASDCTGLMLESGPRVGIFRSQKFSLRHVRALWTYGFLDPVLPSQL